MNTSPQLLRFHYDLRTVFTRYSIPYLWLKRWQQRYLHPQASTGTALGENIKWGAIEQDTDIVIEGYPRLGNTFASSAFRLAQTKPVKIAYRLHASTQLICAAKMNVPAIALIRKPEDAVLSWVIHRSHLTIEQALKGYISFYQTVLPYKDSFVVADFDRVIGDFGAIIKQVNQKYNTSFAEFIHNEENVAQCFAVIDDFYRGAGQGKISTQTVARPSSDRQKLKEQLRGQFNSDRLNKMRLSANQIYSKFIS